MRRAFEQAGIPFKYYATTTGLPGIESGVVLVGEGISLREYPALPEILFRLAAGGRPVLWLAPSEGTVPVPGAPDDIQPRPAAVVVTGRGLKSEQVGRAVHLSAEKYCSASIMLAKTAAITHDFEIVDAEG